MNRTPSAPQYSFDSGMQFFQPEWFREVIIRAGLESGDNIVFVAVSGHHDNRDVSILGVVT